MQIRRGKSGHLLEFHYKDLKNGSRRKPVGGNPRDASRDAEPEKVRDPQGLAL